MRLRPSSLPFLLLILAAACQRSGSSGGEVAQPTSKTLRVGLVTDVGGRGDQSFNDSALRGLELWAADSVHAGSNYRRARPEERKASIPERLAARVTPLVVNPAVLQSKSPEDYEPNLQILVDQGVSLAIGVGFLLENAVETVAARNPDAHFVLIDSQLLDAKGAPRALPNVRTVVFREEEGSFLVGALAARVSQTGTIGFVGGMEIALIKRFEAGFRAGATAVTGKPAPTVRVGYTGSFDNVSAGKLVAQDLIAKGADVLFHAAGADGLGVIQAAKEARAAGRTVWAIGVDSDQAHVAPEVVLTSMVKRVDLAVYEASRDVVGDTFKAGHQSLGLKEEGVMMAPVRVDIPNKDAVLAEVEALRAEIVSGARTVPARPEDLSGRNVP